MIVPQLDTFGMFKAFVFVCGVNSHNINFLLASPLNGPRFALNVFMFLVYVLCVVSSLIV